MARFDVVLTGLKAGADPSEVSRKIAGGFDTPVAKVQAALLSAPTVVRKSVSEETARACKQIIDEAGGTCEIDQTASKHEAAPQPMYPRLCPKCGYEPKGLDAPALTEDDPCPVCGVIPKKFLDAQMRARSVHNGSSPIRVVVPPAPERRSSFKKAAWIGLVTVCLVAIVVGTVHWLSTGTEQAAAPEQPEVVVLGGAATPPGFDKSSPRWIGPGERKPFTVEAYFPILHPETVRLSMTADYTVGDNAWKKQGVEVTVWDSRLVSSTVQLWETCGADGRCRLPSIANKVSAQSLLRGHAAKLIDGQKASLVLRSSTVDAYVELGNETRDAFEKTAKELSFDSVQHTDYRVYKAKVQIFISLPPGDEFDANALVGGTSRTKNITLRTSGAIVDSTNTGWATAGGAHWITFSLWQQSQEPGALVKSSDSVQVHAGHH